VVLLEPVELAVLLEASVPAVVELAPVLEAELPPEEVEDAPLLELVEVDPLVVTTVLEPVLERLGAGCSRAPATVGPQPASASTARSHSGPRASTRYMGQLDSFN
jgi:hypothetical protein